MLNRFRFTRNRKYNELTVWIFNKHILTCHWCKGLLWIRALKKGKIGFVVKNLKKKPVIFPEKFRMRKILRIGNYLIRIGK